MSTFLITAHLSNDFRRTGHFVNGDNIERAALDGCYDGMGFTFRVEADEHLEAAEIAYRVCNSYPGELHCDPSFAEQVAAYRRDGNRSLSTGDMLMIQRLSFTDGADGRYGVASIGFERVQARI